jgi:VIT1/CCC1 family predicted Fe2+/Mn2+ transporter
MSRQPSIQRQWGRRAHGTSSAVSSELVNRMLGERLRVSRLSRIRVLLVSIQDGLLVPLGVVTGLAGASVGSTGVIVGGVATAVAGAIAVGTGAFVAGEAEDGLFRSEIEDELVAFADHPDAERRSLELLLEEEGLSSEDARAVTDRIARSPVSLVKTKVEKELGLPYGEHRTAARDVVLIGAAYGVAALVPLWPYAVWSVGTALAVSLVVTGAVLACVALVKSRVTRVSALRCSIQVLIAAAAAAGLGYCIGVVGSSLLGGGS